MKETIKLPCVYGRLLIREFEAADRETLLEFGTDPDQLQYMLFNICTEKELDDFLDLARTEASGEKRREWHLALEEQEKPGCIGGAALMIEESAPSSAELGYWFKRAVWGRGYATEAARFMLAFGFNVLGLHRIWGKCHIKNPSSAHVMEKIGMQREGEIREHVWMRDHYRTSLLYAILESEYRE